MGGAPSTWEGVIVRRALVPAAALLVFFVVSSSGAVAGETSSEVNETSSEVKRYAVAFNQHNGIPAGAELAMTAAGGRIVGRMEQVGGLAVESSNPNFATEVAALPSVHAVSLDVPFQMIPTLEELYAPDFSTSDAENNGGNASPAGPDPQPMPDNLGMQQWDKMRMNATLQGSYAVPGGQGRKTVTAAVLDTGAEITHPDFTPATGGNLDFARSRSFLDTAFGTEGDPNPANWDDRNGHGSWCASAIAAAINEVGVSGVAPNVNLVALKVLGDNGSGSFLSVINALIYSANNRFDVASLSLGAYAPRSDAGAFLALLQRTVNYARSEGVTVIAALGNDNLDLADGSVMDDTVEIPGELAGVIGVSATGYYNMKSYYSNYGNGKADVTAPGGDRRYQFPPPPYHGGGRVLGATSVEAGQALAPPLREEECEPGPGGPCAYYSWIQGTSMATPNAAGVVALIISQYGEPRNDDPWYMSPTSVESVLQITANNQPCPEGGSITYPFSADPPGTFGPVTVVCQGNAGYNNFYGKGIVDALKAVTLFKPTIGN